MKKTLRKMISIIIITIIIFPTSIVDAHEFSPKRYPTSVYRNNSMNHGVVKLKYTIKVSDSNYKTQLKNSINDLEWQDDGYVDLEETNESNAFVFFYDTWNNADFGSTAYGMTMMYWNKKPVTTYGNNWSGPVYTRNENVFTKCNVYVNKTSQKSAKFTNNDIKKTWAHEIGHTIGFNETNDGTKSIMKQGKGSTFGWSNYWLPQAHDRTDLKNKFQWTIVGNLI